MHFFIFISAVALFCLSEPFSWPSPCSNLYFSHCYPSGWVSIDIPNQVSVQRQKYMLLRYVLISFLSLPLSPGVLTFSICFLLTKTFLWMLFTFSLVLPFSSLFLSLPFLDAKLLSQPALFCVPLSLYLQLFAKDKTAFLFSNFVSTATSKNNCSHEKYKNSLFEGLQHISEAFEEDFVRDVTVCICPFDTELKRHPVHFVDIFNHRQT